MKKHIKLIATILLISLLFTMSAAQAETSIKLHGINMEHSGTFAAEHPNVRLVQDEYTFYETTGDLTSDLLLGAFDADVFSMTNSFIDYRVIMEKGYCLDLSSSAIIQNVMQRLHPSFAQSCMMDGMIYAIPYNFQLNYMTISPATLALSGIGDVEIPTTFPEFLDFLELWIEHLKKNPDCGVALLGSGYWGDPTYYYPDSYTGFLVDELLQNYIMQMEFTGEAVSFDEAELIPLLERCYQIGQDLYLYDPGVQANDSILNLSGATIVRDGEDFLSLRLNSSQPKLIPTYMGVYVVNAGTHNPEVCIELLESLCMNNQSHYTAYFYQDSEPLLDPQYDSRVENLEGLIQDTQRQLAGGNLDAAYRAELEFRLERQQANLQKLMDNEDEKYLVSAAELEHFRSYADCVFVQMPGLFNANDVENAQAFKQLKKRFCTGQMSATELVKELNRMAWMIEMEQQ